MARLKNAAGQLLNEVQQTLRRVLRPVPPSTNGRAPWSREATLGELRRTGYVVMPNFVGRARCADLIRRIDAGLSEYSRFVQIDDTAADHRLFGLDAVDEEIRNVAFDPFAVDVLTRYERASRYEGFALCARLEARPGNRGSGQGWHRDSAAYKQTKLMVYLTDVSADNGPFQYIAGSHHALDVVRCAVSYGFDVNQHRLGDDAVARVIAAQPGRLRTLTATAGTAILFDSRGMHRGMPIVAGKRYAITTYLWFNQAAASHVRAWTIEAQQRNGPARAS
jgi:hypothetical protein